MNPLRREEGPGEKGDVVGKGWVRSEYLLDPHLNLISWDRDMEKLIGMREMITTEVSLLLLLVLPSLQCRYMP